MHKALFITGTNTGIGKTYTCLKFAEQLIAQNKKVAYFKPIQTGCTQKDACGNWLAPDCEVIKENCPQVFTKYTYAYALPATPELAARQENDKISFNKIKADFEELKKNFEHVLVEGAGGLFVPVGEGQTIGHLIKFLDLPMLLVSANKLGTINHTCLSIYYAKSLNLNLIGFSFAKLPLNDDTVSEVAITNAEFISTYGGISFINLL